MPIRHTRRAMTKVLVRSKDQSSSFKARISRLKKRRWASASKSRELSYATCVVTVTFFQKAMTMKSTRYSKKARPTSCLTWQRIKILSSNSTTCTIDRYHLWRSLQCPSKTIRTFVITSLYVVFQVRSRASSCRSGQSISPNTSYRRSF